MNRFLRLTVAGAVAVLLSGCADLARLVTPSGTDDLRPAHVAMTAMIATPASASAVDVVSLRVTSAYLDASNTRVPIAAQTIALSSAATQTLPIPVELAGCLADANRADASSGAACTVFLELALSVNGTVVDRQTIGPLRLAPGATTNVNDPVTLFEIASVSVSPADVNLLIGGDASLTSVVRDSRGQSVPSRPVLWSSDAPTVATVDQTGRVVAVAAGTAHVTATLGTFSASTAINVTRPTVALTVAASGSGSGHIVSAPVGIDCAVTSGVGSGVCAFNFAADAQVTLTSTASSGQQFAAWGGACASQAVSNSCVLTMGQPQSASAQFVALRRVTITSLGEDGRGHVTGAGGLDCRIDGATVSGTCAVDVPEGSALVLSAAGDAASGNAVAQVFAGWGGACAATGSAACTLTPAGANLAVQAGFHDGRTLTVAIDGAGGGRVSSASGISCLRAAATTSGECARLLSYGSSVTLVPEADGASEFSGWGGACAGQPLLSCTVQLSQARTVNATFVRQRVSLTLRLAGTGGGSVTVNGATACSRSSDDSGVVDCVRQYDIGTSVTIEGNPDLLSDFAGHTGDCNGAGTCILTMNAPRAVTSTFNLRPGVLLKVEPRGASGSGTIRSTEATPLIDCTITNGAISGGRCSALVQQGAQVTLQASGAVNNALAFWGAACSGRTTFECTVRMDVPLEAFAGFSAGIDVEMRTTGGGAGTITFEPEGAPSQRPCVVAEAGTSPSCRFSLPESSPLGVFKGLPSGGTFGGFVGPCVESTGADPVPVCTWRGIGFLRVITATFHP